jgi:hypothetical protein
MNGQNLSCAGIYPVGRRGIYGFANYRQIKIHSAGLNMAFIMPFFLFGVRFLQVTGKLQPDAIWNQGHLSSFLIFVRWSYDD